MDIPQIKGQLYSYADYLNWSRDERYELIWGRPYVVSPETSNEHQIVLGELFFHFRSYLRGKSRQVFMNPFDVRLPQNEEKDEEIKSVVQPDISIVCDKNKIDRKGCKGAPDLIVEIVSSLTFRRDVKDKFFLYERSGVKEYWLVFPNERTVMVFKLMEGNRYGRPEIYADEDSIKVGIFKELVINLKEIFTSNI